MLSLEFICVKTRSHDQLASIMVHDASLIFSIRTQTLYALKCCQIRSDKPSFTEHQNNSQGKMKSPLPHHLLEQAFEGNLQPIDAVALLQAEIIPGAMCSALCILRRLHCLISQTAHNKEYIKHR